MQRFVDNVLAVTKESVKTVTFESLHNIVRLINGISAILLTVLPGKTTMLEGLQGWELKPTFRGPRLPRWMGNGVSSFNRFIHELSVDSDASSVEYLSGEDDSDGDITPSTPLSPRSLFSHTSTFRKRNDPWHHWIGCIFSWLMLPFRCLLGLPFHLYYFLCYKRPRSHAPHQPIRSHTPIKIQSLKDHAVHHATDRRRGVIEDLHLAMEISIETIFDFFHKAAHFLLSPVQALNILFGWVFCRPSNRGYAEDCPVESIQTATLGADDPTPAERKATFHPLNTDARTCQDVITELGYPYEAIHVVTADGYILLLERIPRRDSRKAAYLQHGVFDSSMGWIANGVVGSPAFAAFDQGYDVFLGNFRGLVSREHANRNMSSKQYWKYSINEHGTADIPALIEKIHEVKTAELKLQDPNSDEVNGEEQPYNLCAICHSLGGAGILMYLVTRLVEQKPQRLSRLVLLSPAGFHDDSTFVFTLVEYFFLTLGPILAPLFPAFYIPTRFFRMLVNKLARDLHNYPAVGGLIQTLMGYVVGGDSSNWVGVLGLPHYNMNDMPGVSFYVAVHLAQMKRTGRFRMFDHGSASANMRAYGSPKPLDVAECYGLIDIPVDLVAGKKDRVIRPSMVRRHYRLMKEAGVEVSYKEFEYAHLDFTFSHREELLAYVMSRVQLVKPSGGADAESAKVDKLK